MGESTWAQTPTAEPVAVIQKLAAGYVLLPEDDEVNEVALAGIRRAIDEINARNWNWLLSYDDLEFVADQGDYPLTSWFKRPRRFTIFNQESAMRFKAWADFVDETSNVARSGSPCVYTCPNVFALGTVTFDVAPSDAWVKVHPTGRLHYFRKMQYPGDPGESLDCPSEFTKYVLESACAFTADRYAPSKASSAYGRAANHLRNLIADDLDTQTDWE